MTVYDTGVCDESTDYYNINIIKKSSHSKASYQQTLSDII